MKTRLKQLVSTFPKLKIKALLVTQDANIRYLTDFPASESWLFVTPKGATYITDSRYTLEARQGLKGVKVFEFRRSKAAAVFELAKAGRIKNIGFDETDVTVAQLKTIKKQAPKGIKLKATAGVVEALRLCKDKGEIGKIRKALKLHAQAHQYLKRVLKPGLSERQVLLKLEQFVKSRGAGFSFDPIIASGSNSCYPHAKVTGRKIRTNDVVLIDMGIDLDGYKSDLTRMFFLGKIPQSVTRVNEAVKQAQREAIAQIQEGIRIGKIDQLARNSLAKKKLDKYFGHALGHGVGLEIHEDPRISSQNRAKLKEGMVITIEPAVYLPNQFGIRIEDMVLVTRKGCEVLSDYID